MNILTDEECSTVFELSQKEELNLTGAGHGYRYYGVSKGGNEKDIKILEEILRKWCPDLVSFCNFTNEDPNRIRVIAQYSPQFQGVHYLPLPTNELEPERQSYEN